jgi:hypothetical protein
VSLCPFLHVRRFPLALHQLEAATSPDLIVRAADGSCTAPVTLGAMTMLGHAPSVSLSSATSTECGRELGRPTKVMGQIRPRCQIFLFQFLFHLFKSLKLIQSSKFRGKLWKIHKNAK